jgi:hypothetical protein
MAATSAAAVTAATDMWIVDLSKPPADAPEEVRFVWESFAPWERAVWHLPDLTVRKRLWILEDIKHRQQILHEIQQSAAQDRGDNGGARAS